MAALYGPLERPCLVPFLVIKVTNNILREGEFTWGLVSNEYSPLYGSRNMWLALTSSRLGGIGNRERAILVITWLPLSLCSLGQDHEMLPLTLRVSKSSYLSQISLETPIKTYPELCCLGDPKSSHVVHKY